MKKTVKVSEGDIIVFFDGSCGPFNPGGEMGWGFVVKLVKDGEYVSLHSESGFEPESEDNSNNVAEYMALHDSLIWLIKNGHNTKRVFFAGDSKLVINQMEGWWRIKAGLYKETAIVVKSLLKEWFKDCYFQWIPRSLNEEADELSKAHQLNKK